MKGRLILGAGLFASLTAVFAPAQTVPDFYARRDYVGLYSQWTAVADTNGDGIPDLIATDGGFLQVLFGNGDGTFRSGPTENLPDIGSSIPVDLNGDGKIDLISSGNQGNGLIGGFYVFPGNGDGTFNSGVFYATGSDNGNLVGFPTVGDFNGDGIPDVVIGGPSGVWLFTGRGGGTFDQGIVTVSLPTASSTAAADFNGDGKLDLVVGTYVDPRQGPGNGFFVMLGNGDGTFQTMQNFTTPAYPHDIVAGILGTGGHAGIVLNDGPSYVTVYHGNGAGGFTGPQYVPLPTSQFTLAIGDINADGIPDVVSAAGSAYVAYGTTNNSFVGVEYPIQPGLGIYNVALADLRNNGRIDIITDSQYGVSVLLNKGKAKFEDGVAVKSPPAGCGVTGDFNGDGKPDIAVNTGAGISILLGTGNTYAPLKAGQNIAVPGAGCLTAVGDVNGDGILDLVIANSTGVGTYLGNGDGTFTLKSSTVTSAVSPFVVLADLNHDGKLDFATAGNVFALGNGDGTFQTPQPIVTPGPQAGFSYIVAGDINNDGWPDLVLPLLGLPETNVYVLLNNKRGGFKQVPQTFGFGTNQAILADLNGDGNLDLLLDNSLYLGNGKGNFTFQVIAASPISANYLTPSMVADLNGDGIPDVAVWGTGTVAINLGLGNATYAPPFFLGLGPSPGFLIPANLHGQSPQAGLPDLVVPDNTGGIVVLPNLTK